jgi:hypothetical protein
MGIVDHAFYIGKGARQRNMIDLQYSALGLRDAEWSMSTDPRVVTYFFYAYLCSRNGAFQNPTSIALFTPKQAGYKKCLSRWPNPQDSTPPNIHTLSPIPSITHPCQLTSHSLPHTLYQSAWPLVEQSPRVTCRSGKAGLTGVSIPRHGTRRLMDPIQDIGGMDCVGAFRRPSSVSCI